MRRVVLYQLLSFDGVAEEPSDWMFDAGQEVVDNLRRIIASQDDVLFGRGTYDYWVDYWPASDFEPFASFINHTEKHVFTSRALDREWEHSTAVSTPAAEYVAQLKQGDGGDIGIHGSIQLAQSLWRDGLIDVLELVIAPTVAGRGRRLFEHELPAGRLDLVDLARTPGGSLFLSYRRSGDDSS
ncbi:MAG TPA: dihydrofolate reductase family protein [Ilumatobacteraceae bacterium]|nr:dihydrofolate reductase family protein [Ilumatobacteraceae bacterium]